jgi:translation initiation factor 2 subunit 3
MVQPKINIGIVGHVDHGKTTLTKALSGMWTDTHSEEKKRGITIKLGYTNFSIYKNKKSGEFTLDKKNDFLEIYSIVDSPGHESFMATMIGGSSVMDYGILLIDSTEICPQPQTIEHIKALEISNCKNIIVALNKIDLIEKKTALKKFEEVETFLKTTKFKDSKIIPISAFHKINLKYLLENIYNEFKEIKRDTSKDLKFSIIRSFDINKPGLDYKKVKGGVLGISIKEGKINIGDEIEIKPGILQNVKGKPFFKTIYGKVVKLKSSAENLEVGLPGGSLAISTELDSVLTKADSLVGQIGGLKSKLNEITYQITLDLNLFKSIIVNSNDKVVKPIVLNEILMLIVNSLTTVGQVVKADSKSITLKLKRPILEYKNDKVVIFRQMEMKKWKIIGFGKIK